MGGYNLHNKYIIMIIKWRSSLMYNNGFNLGLSNIPIMIKGKSRSICAENPTGKPGYGGQAASNLGATRKGRPCINLKGGNEHI